MNLVLSLILSSTILSFQPMEFNLKDYRWENRIVMIFSSQNNARYRNQIEELMNDKAGLEDRDLLIFSIDKQAEITDLLHANQLQSSKNLRIQLDIPETDFYVLLIGKDGTVKLRDNTPVSRDKLYAIIDAMPMRQAEMRRNK